MARTRPADGCPHCGHNPPTALQLGVDAAMLTVAAVVAYGRYRARVEQDARVRDFRGRLDTLDDAPVVDAPPAGD